MKYCPTCDTRYDEDILRFCMKDGTPLLDEAEPNFVEMPSESLENAIEIEEDDPGEVTVIRRNVPVPPLPPTPDEDFSVSEEPAPPQRIVVPTFEQQQAQAERARVAAHYQAQQPRRGSTILVVFLTMFGTVIVLGIGAIGFWFLAGGRLGGANQNSNANVNANLANDNTNLNTNLGLGNSFDFNANFGLNSNSDTNANANANAKSPTPKPSSSPTPSPTPDEDETPTPTPNVNIAPATPRPTVTPTPRPAAPSAPRPTPTPIIVGTPRTIMTPSNRP